MKQLTTLTSDHEKDFIKFRTNYLNYINLVANRVDVHTKSGSSYDLVKI
jgi:hypothetical protein